MNFSEIEHPPSQWANYVDYRERRRTEKERLISINAGNSSWWADPYFLAAHRIYTAQDLLNFLAERGLPTSLTLQSNLARSGFFQTEEDCSISLIKTEEGDPVLACDPDKQILTVHVEDLRGNDPFGMDGSRYLLLPSDFSPSPEEWHYRYEDFWFDGSKVRLYLSKRTGSVSGTSSSGSIQRYNYVPQYIKRCLGPKDVDEYFGIEIEMSADVSSQEMYRIITEVEPKQDPFVYFKSDSSIYRSKSYAYEMVSHPCTMKYLRTNLRILFKKLETLAKEKGIDLSSVIDMEVRSSNGFHVHIDKNVFKTGSRGRLARGWRNRFASILNLWDRESVTLLTELARRPNRLDENNYCKPHARMKHRTLGHRLRVGPRNEIYEDRYAACRFTENTVEVRMFQGHFDLQHLLYCLQVVESLLKFSSEVPISVINMRFSRFFKNWLSTQNRFTSVKKEVL